MIRLFLNGTPVEVPERESLGRALLERFCPSSSELPSGAEPPYLFCGNGGCRDCNLHVEGLPDIPACRVPLAAGFSLRTNADNALARRLPEPAAGEPLVADVVAIGGGWAGRAVPEAVILETRAPDPRPVGADKGRLIVLENGRRRAIEARVVVIATGARDIFPTLPGFLPMDLVERYADAGTVPFPRLVLAGEGDRAEALRFRLLALGAESVEITLARTVSVPPPGVVVATGRRQEPCLELARALGCRTRYDRASGTDSLVLSEDGETSVPGVFALGAVAGDRDTQAGRTG